MANIGTSIADTSGFIPQVWAQRALDVLRANMVLAKIVRRDSDFEPGWIGKTLNIPYPGTFVANDKSANTAATVQTPSNGASVPISLTKHKDVDFLVEDVARAQASMELLDVYVQPAAIALGNQVEDDLFALYASMSYSVGTSGTDIVASAVRSAAKKLNDNLAPVTPRHLIVSAKDQISILGDSNLASYFAFSQSSAIADGSIGNLYGFKTWMSQRVPVVAGTPNSTKNLALTPDLMMLATRPFRDPPANSGVNVASISDPETGITIRVLQSYDISFRSVRVGFDILYGVALLRDVCGAIVLS